MDIRQAGLLIQKWFEIRPERKKQLTKGKKRVRKEEREVKPEEEIVNPPLTFELKTLDRKRQCLKERGLKRENHKGIWFRLL